MVRCAFRDTERNDHYLGHFVLRRQFECPLLDVRLCGNSWPVSDVGRPAPVNPLAPVVKQRPVIGRFRLEPQSRNALASAQESRLTLSDYDTLARPRPSARGP